MTPGASEPQVPNVRRIRFDILDLLQGDAKLSYVAEVPIRGLPRKAFPVDANQPQFLVHPFAQKDFDAFDAVSTKSVHEIATSGRKVPKFGRIVRLPLTSTKLCIVPGSKNSEGAP
jgi:hypothetical protein